MLVDLGLHEPIEGDTVCDVSENLSEAVLWERGKKRTVNLKLPPSALVELLGGGDAFVTITYSAGGRQWLRRNMIRNVLAVPPPVAKVHGKGTLIQMVYDESPSENFPEKRADPPPFSAYLWGLNPGQVRTMISAGHVRETDSLDVSSDSIGGHGLVNRESTARPPAPVSSTAPPTAEQLSTALASNPLAGAAENITALARPQWFALEASEAEASSFLLDPSGAASGPIPVFALDLARSNADLGLPRQGALIFSYDAYSKPWGDEPTDAGSFSVMLSQASARETAEASGLRFVAIGLVEGISLPAIDSLPGDLLPIDSDDEAEAYLELLEELYGEPGSPGGAPGTWLGGYPYQLQDDMQEQCAEMAKSTWGLESEPEEWRLLLQLASESAANMCWEDDGFLYYWIRESDLAKHDFSHVWCILQTM